MENINFSKADILHRIKEIRTQKKMSAYQLGLQLGHAKTYFYRIETGEIQLTIDTFLEVLEVLNVTTTEFFCPPRALDHTTKQFLALSPENQQIVLELIKRLQK